MNHAIEALRLLADGVPRSVTEVAQALGLTEAQAANTLAHNRGRGRIASTPVLYAITPAGVEHSAFVPMTRAQRVAKAEAKRRELRAAAALLRKQAAEKKLANLAEARAKRAALKAAAEKHVSAPMVNTNALIESGMRSRTALDMAWGAGLGAREGAQA